MDFPPLPTDRVLKVFVDYGQYFRDHLTDPRFEVVESMSDADIIWTRRHFNDFKYTDSLIQQKIIYFQNFDQQELLTIWKLFYNKYCKISFKSCKKL